MKWVLDSNIGVKWLLQEDQSDKARVRDGYSRGLHDLLAPDIFTVDCCAGICRAHALPGDLSPLATKELWLGASSSHRKEK